MAVVLRKQSYPNQYEYIKALLKEYPLWSYQKINQVTKSGVSNICTVARNENLTRDSRKLKKQYREEIKNMICDDAVDYNDLYQKYGLYKNEVKKIIQGFAYSGETKERKIIRLLTQSDAVFPVIAYIAKTNIFYVSQIAKKIGIASKDRTGTDQENLILLATKSDITCLKASYLLHMDIDEVIAFYQQNYPSIQITHKDTFILKEFREGISLVEIVIHTGIDEYVVESVLLSSGITEILPYPDSNTVLNFLQENPLLSWTCAANHFQCTVHDIKKISIDHGIQRKLIQHNWDTRFEVLNEIYTQPNKSYAKIGDQYNRTPCSISLIAKEYGLSRKKNIKQI